MTVKTSVDSAILDWYRRLRLRPIRQFDNKNRPQMAAARYALRDARQIVNDRRVRDARHNAAVAATRAWCAASGRA